MQGSRIALTLLAGLLAAAPLAAQEAAAPRAQLVDRVVAVVGDSAILGTEVEQELLLLAAAGQAIPEDPAALAALRRQIVDALVEKLILVQAAERDSITVDAQEVESTVNRRVTQQQRAMGGERAFLEALRREGMTLREYREMQIAAERQNLMIQRYLQKLQRDRRPPPVTDAEVERYFESQRERLPAREAMITFEQVVIAPEPSDSARAAAKARAEEVLAKLAEGEDFAQVARRYSEDPGSRERGGDLGWFRQGVMVREFERAVFSMRPGQVSPVVESPFGLHIIKLEKVRGAERQARHILIRPAVGPADVERARERGRNVADRLRGGESVASLAERFGDDSEQIRVGPYPRDSLPEPYGRELAEATNGAIIGPFELPGVGGAPKFAVVKVVAVVEAGETTLADVRGQIREYLQRQKLLGEIADELRARTYVELRLE